MFFASRIYPYVSTDLRMMSFLESSLINFSTSSDAFSASSLDVVISIADAISSCSACDKRSAATYLAFAVSSARTNISLGPATESMLTCPNTHLFASATNMFPGPTILSTFGMLSVPYASAAIACAPPAL